MSTMPATNTRYSSVLMAATGDGEEGAAMAKRPQRPDPTSGPIARQRSLTAGVARLRLRNWGATKPRLLQRMAYYLRTLREQSGESMEDAAVAAQMDGEQATRRTIWYLEQLSDVNVAQTRERVNLMLVAYLAERWGSSLPDVWEYMTREEAGTAEASQPTEARALGDLYLHLSEVDPARARQLIEYALFTLDQSERDAEDRQGATRQGRADTGKASAEREAPLGEDDAGAKGRRGS